MSIFKVHVLTLFDRFYGTGCRSPHAVWDVDVEDRDQDVCSDGESDREATEDLEVVEGVPL